MGNRLITIQILSLNICIWHLWLTYLDLHETHRVQFNISICNNLASQQGGVSAKTAIQTVTVIKWQSNLKPTSLWSSDAYDNIWRYRDKRDLLPWDPSWQKQPNHPVTSQTVSDSSFLIRTMIWESEMCLYWDRKPVSPLASSLCCSAERLDVNMSPGWAALALFYTTLKKWEFKRVKRQANANTG